MPVLIAQRIQRLVRDRTGRSDPYRVLKDRMNRIALDLLPQLAEQAKNHHYPGEAVTRLAIAGNLLDAGAKVRLAPEDLAERLKAIWDKPLVGSVEELFHAADAASRILYLADNAGEIVFDRLLIEALPSQKITVAVRGVPVINDATMEDAKTAGIDKLVQVIANGSDAPGTLIEECSEDFRDAFKRADLVIAKGQGNYETMSDSSKNVFFLLSVKCPLIAADIGAPVGSLVVKPNISYEKTEESENKQTDLKGAKNMRIALPVTDGKLSAHFGHCEQFALFDADEKTGKIIDRQMLAPPVHEPGVLPRWLHEQGAGMIIAGGMGQRAQSLFAENEIQVIVGASGEDPERIATDYFAGTLQAGPNVCDH